MTEHVFDVADEADAAGITSEPASPNGTGPRYVIHVADFTVKQIDLMDRLERQRGWGRMAAMTYVFLKMTDPTITREAVEAMRSGDIQIIGDPADKPDEATFQPS